MLAPLRRSLNEHRVIGARMLNGTQSAHINVALTHGGLVHWCMLLSHLEISREALVSYHCYAHRQSGHSLDGSPRHGPQPGKTHAQLLLNLLSMGLLPRHVLRQFYR